MPSAEPGSTIRVHYFGTLVDGTPFSPADGTMLEFTVCNGEVVEGLDVAVLGMQIGDRREMLIPVHQAYGERRNDLLMQVKRSDLPAGDIDVGTRVSANTPFGQMDVTVISVAEDSAMVDGNHPLAGHDLLYTLDLVDVVREAEAA